MSDFSDPPVVAAVDLGSNSFRLQIARVTNNGLLPLDSIKETVRLSAGLDENKVLDQAAQRIVRLAAPYAPFTGDLADIDRLEIIRTWRFARGDRLSSN